MGWADVECPTCLGEGHTGEECIYCYGEGEEVDQDGEVDQCWECNGTGELEEECEDCSGSCHVEVNTEENVNED